MNDEDRLIITEMQKIFPLDSRPFDRLGERLGLEPDRIMEAVIRLKEEGYIRQISAIFDTQSLGYTSSLVAFQVAPDQVDAAAAAINRHPGVSHNYLRENNFNVWFTLAVPPGEDLERDMAILAREAKAIAVLPLPTLALYKIGVQFDLTDAKTEEPATPTVATPTEEPADPTPLTEKELAAVLALQDDLVIGPEPFKAVAKAAGMTEPELFAQAAAFKQSGRLRRYCAVVRHRKVGFSANGMVIWQVPEERQDSVGKELALFKAVSHCYRRPTTPAWPYSLFTMVHAKEPAECERIATEMAKQVAIDDYTILYSTREFKKERVRYFTDDYSTWKAAHPA